MSNFSERDDVEEQFMDYEESSEEEMVERDNLGDEMVISDEEADMVDPDIVSLQEKGKPNRHSLEVRRAIEDHLEKTRLRKELDYLFDDDFSSENDAA